MKKVVTIVMGLGVWLALATAASASVTVETVTVSDPNNPDDTNGFGRVGYTFNIAKFEITAGQYCEFLNAVAGADPYGLYNTGMDSDTFGCQITRHGSSPNYTYDFSGGTVEAPGSTAADWANRPVNWVGWGDAARFANWLHNGQPTGPQGLSTTEDGSYSLNGATTDAQLLAIVREPDATWAIPSEDEWYKAAYYSGSGSTYFDYPTGTNVTPSNDLVNPDPGNNATYRVSPTGTHYTIGSPYYRTEIGEHENSESPYGTFDQGGNVWEWNEAVIGSSRGLRGSAYYGQWGELDASYRGGANVPTRQSGDVGFRVAQVPEPATLGLLAWGGLALLRRRR